MRISTEGLELQCFDYEKAADHWAGMCNRRLSIGLTSGSSKSSSTSVTKLTICCTCVTICSVSLAFV